MAARKCGAPPIAADGSTRRPDCVTAVRTQARAPTQHYAESVARRQRVLTITAWLAVVVTGSFALMQLATGAGGWYIALINVFTAVTFAIVPLLHRFGGLVAPLTFIGTAYVAIFAIGWDVGTDAGAQFFFLVAAALVVLLVGIEHTALAVGLAAVAAGLVIALEFLVPPDTGLQPPWAMSVSFVLTTVSACGVAVATVWFALRDTARAEAVMEAEHDRSEALLANMLPASIAERLKEPERNIIADKYDEASVLFADIVGFTERASSTAPADLVRFLDRLYSAFDELVDQLVESAVEAVQEPDQVRRRGATGAFGEPDDVGEQHRGLVVFIGDDVSLGFFKPLGDAGRQHVGQQCFGAVVLRLHDRLRARSITQREPHRCDRYPAGGDGREDETYRHGPGRLKPSIGRDQELQGNHQTGGDRR